MKATGDRDPGFVRDIRRLERQLADLDHRIRVAEAVHEADIDEVVEDALGLSDALPAAVGTAAAGTGTTASRADHVHAHGNQAGGGLHANAVASGAAGFLTGADKAKLDASGELASAAPASVGTANAVGVGTTAARADHVHNHGAQTDGSLHAAVVAGGASGFMTGADKTILNNLAAWVPVDVFAVGSQNLTRDGSNNALDTIAIDEAYINVRRLAMLVGPGVYSSNAACPDPWMEAGTIDGQIVILHNAGTQTIQINTTAKPNIRLESNTNKSLGVQDYIVFIWNNADTRWDQLVTLMPLT